MPKEMWPVAIFTMMLIVAVILGNMFLSYVMQRPIDEVPNILKFIVHGISLTFIAVLAKKYFVK